MIESRDRKFLSLQFWNKIHEKNGSEFQIFVENILEKVFSDFRKVRPYGNKGDGGNDGFRPSEGVYYQVYAPLNPLEKESVGAEKLRDDFNNLKKTWNEISSIREYNFVFNDKNKGTNVVIENALADLRGDNQNIKFKIYTPRDLEKDFLKLGKEEILQLGFDLDSSKALQVARHYFDRLEVALDRDRVNFVLNNIDILRKIVDDLQDEDLLLDFSLFEARTLQRRELVDQAIDAYGLICKKAPEDPRAFLYLAEIFLGLGDLNKNDLFLKKAESINKGYWFLELEKLFRKYVQRESLELSLLDIDRFSHEPKVKALFYRIYACFLDDSKEYEKSDSFIEKSISLNPDKLSAYEVKLSILESRLSSLSSQAELRVGAKNLLSEVEKVEQKFNESGDLSSRSKAQFALKKFIAFNILEDFKSVEEAARTCFEFILQCYFDRVIDSLLVRLLTYIEVPQPDFNKLQDYLRASQKSISDELAKRMVFQFNLKKQLFVEGKVYFEAIKNNKYLDFIDDLENRRDDKVLTFLSDDLPFAVLIANSMWKFPDLRLKIIESIPDDTGVRKDKLLLLLSYDEGDIEKAFDLLRQFDISTLNKTECLEFLRIAEEKKAWDFVVRLLDNILSTEKDNRSILQFKLKLFTANFNLGKFKEVIQIGEELLENKELFSLLSDLNKENLLSQTILARLTRSEFELARNLLSKYENLGKTFEFFLGIKTDVYLKNNDGKDAIKAIVEGIKIIKNPTPEQYGYLYFFFVELSNLDAISLDSKEEVVLNSFVKFKDQDRWFFLGDDHELDATKILPSDAKYLLFANKRVGEEVVFDSKYSSSKSINTIEIILSIEQYIYWQCVHQAGRLTQEKRWSAMEAIEVPATETGIDTQYLTAKLEDLERSKGDFYNSYTEQNLPFAFLAFNQGGLTSAIGKILNEQKGFIKFSTGDVDEINRQKDVAKRIIGGDSFYIDGMSALALSETGLLEKIYKHLDGLKTPQSVINLLFEIKAKFRYSPGQLGHMGYSQGKIALSSVNRENRDKVESNLLQSIKIFELIPENITAISEASKSSSFSESKIDPSLSDACVFAQKDSAIILTEDFLYLQFNNFETHKPIPEYCSSFALVRVLYDSGKLSFEDYLGFFSYLASYRFRFLPVSAEDIEKAVFGDGEVKTINPGNIRLLHFDLTLSEDYGVPFERALVVVSQFFAKILLDNSILPEMIEKIFEEIISSLPTDRSKNTLGKILLSVSLRIIKNTHPNLIVSIELNERVKNLLQFIEFYTKKDLILP